MFLVKDDYDDADGGIGPIGGAQVLVCGRQIEAPTMLNPGDVIMLGDLPFIFQNPSDPSCSSVSSSKASSPRVSSGARTPPRTPLADYRAAGGVPPQFDFSSMGIDPRKAGVSPSSSSAGGSPSPVGKGRYVRLMCNLRPFLALFLV